jgi:hypothetical protein
MRGEASESPAGIMAQRASGTVNAGPLPLSLTVPVQATPLCVSRESGSICAGVPI